MNHESYNEIEIKFFSLCENGQLKLIEQLFKEKVIISKNVLNRCLMNICRKFNYIHDLENVILMLLSKGADINYKEDQNGYTPLIIAVKSGQLHLLKLLLKNYADINVVDNFGQSAIFYTIQQEKTIFYQIMQFLLSNDCNVDLVNKNKENPLLIALKNNLDKAVVALAKKSKNLEYSEEKSGNSLMHLAALYNNEFLVKYLLKKGFLNKDNLNEQNQTPSDLTQNKKILEILLKSNQKKDSKKNKKQKNKKKDKTYKLQIFQTDKTKKSNKDKIKSLSFEDIPFQNSNKRKKIEKELSNKDQKLSDVDSLSFQPNKNLSEIEQLKLKKKQLMIAYQKELKKKQKLLEKLNKEEFDKKFLEFEDLQSNEETISIEENFGLKSHRIQNFESNIVFNSLKSFDENSQQEEYCESCSNIFNYKITYDNDNLEKVLNQEIKEFEENVDFINYQKQNMFNNLLQNIQNVIQSVINIKFKIHTYGSYANGLNLHWSDIDLLIEFFESVNNLEILQLIEKEFKKIENFTEIKCIKSAHIPVLKLSTDQFFQHTKIDITIKESNHLGLNCVLLIKQYLILYKPLKTLTLVLKNFLKQAELNDPYLGGLSSYGLILMIVAFFQYLIHKNSYQDIENNCAKLLIEFLRFFSNTFDYMNNQIVPHQYPQHDQNYNPFSYVVQKEKKKQYEFFLQFWSFLELTCYH